MTQAKETTGIKAEIIKVRHENGWQQASGKF